MYLTQDLEVLIRRVYLEAHVKTLQEVLARGLELESILWSTRRVRSPFDAWTSYRAKWGRMESSSTQSHHSLPQPHLSPPLGVFQGNCFGCGHPGHSRRYWPQGRFLINEASRWYQYPCY
ncbi:hypothetical protein E2C01_019371 [Portunus trituberculatus]|uniref:Uncharacterized protein n=1 Tax=Portunus trituberculatus TaxID=210409 RepID=A0A5B7DYV2_PORTR|nr:hypothetical protein [Portunus trituberculatus]